MRLVNLYLSGYFLLLIGALVSLWYGGVLGHVSPVWVLGGVVVAVGLGLMLFLSAARPESRN